MNDSSIREHTMNSISLNIATETSLKKNVIVTAHGNKSHIIAKYFGCHSRVVSSAYVLTLHVQTRIYAYLPRVMGARNLGIEGRLII